MSRLLPKPFFDLSCDDIKGLIGAEESIDLEFKEIIPGDYRGGASGSWADQRKLTDDAKKKIVKEVVAMANALGGDVIIGMEEETVAGKGTGRAKRLSAIQEPERLRTQLEDCFRDAIDPPILGLMARKLECESTADEGMVVIRVPQSSTVHRSTIGRNEVFRRIDRSAQPISMREIEDLILSRRSRTDMQATRLQSRRLSPSDQGVGLKVRASSPWQK